MNLKSTQPGEAQTGPDKMKETVAVPNNLATIKLSTFATKTLKRNKLLSLGNKRERVPDDFLLFRERFQFSGELLSRSQQDEEI